eukprot:Skav203942  [mRNA]  locus=scaffold391:34381:40485:- [translate_table: standard]
MPPRWFPTISFEVFRSLEEHGMNACALHGRVHPDKRKDAYNALSPRGKDLMVCTNLASRGLDFSHVHHVVMYDFPLNMADYLHRVGRTARGGRAGRKILAIENFQKVIQHDAARAETVNKSVKQKLKKRLGLPPARNIGSKETKAAMKRLDRRMRKAIKELRFLWRRGILKRGQKIPAMQAPTDKQVEASETQTVTTMVRARDGLLQLLPRRRSGPRLARHAPNAGGTVTIGGLGGRSAEAPGSNRRRRRTQM